MSTSADRMRRKRQRDAERAVIVAGAEQASQEKHESVTQRAERVEPSGDPHPRESGTIDV